jgi:hypothetical protein
MYSSRTYSTTDLTITSGTYSWKDHECTDFLDPGGPLNIYISAVNVGSTRSGTFERKGLQAL